MTKYRGVIEAFGAIMLAGFAMAGISYAIGRAGFDTDARAWVMGAMLFVGAVFGLWLGARWYGAIDEASREAHKAGWYWGGSIAMVVAAPIIGYAASEGDDFKVPIGPNEIFHAPFFQNAQTSGGYFAMGAALVLLLLLAGYAIVWAGWWVIKR